MSDEEATQALRVLARHGVDAPVSQRAELIARLALDLLVKDPGLIHDSEVREIDYVTQRAGLILAYSEGVAEAQTHELTSGGQGA